MTGQPRDDADKDQAADGSFPASDPRSTTPTSGPGGSRQPPAAPDDEEHLSKGQPTDDRLAGETASGRVQGIHPPQTDHR